MYISVDIFVAKCRDLHVINVNNFDANNKLHTFLFKKQYLNIHGVGLLFHVKTLYNVLVKMNEFSKIYLNRST